jgi:formamidopyrimidine-DNA glycosylase
VLRRGKHLILLLSGNSGIVVHLRMTGALFFCEPPAGMRVRAVLRFSNGEQLLFADTRRLGKLQYYENLKPLLVRLGPEPLDEDFTAEAMGRALSRHRIPIKAALLDQHIIAGVGNMYADESLFEARINPVTPAGELNQVQVQHLWESIRSVLRRAIERQGASVDTYWLPDGGRGTAHDAFCVAHRKGAPCPGCGLPIERLMVRKRGAYHCPRCQPLPVQDTPGKRLPTQPSTPTITGARPRAGTATRRPTP